MKRRKMKGERLFSPISLISLQNAMFIHIWAEHKAQPFWRGRIRPPLDSYEWCYSFLVCIALCTALEGQICNALFSSKCGSMTEEGPSTTITGMASTAWVILRRTEVDALDQSCTAAASPADALAWQCMVAHSLPERAINYPINNDR